jgi:hypothetical protein
MSRGVSRRRLDVSRRRRDVSRRRLAVAVPLQSQPNYESGTYSFGSQRAYSFGSLSSYSLEILAETAANRIACS